jgi:hypothetical protein
MQARRPLSMEGCAHGIAEDDPVYGVVNIECCFA